MFEGENILGGEKKEEKKKKRVFEKKKIAHVFQAVLYIFLRALVEY